VLDTPPRNLVAWAAGLLVLAVLGVLLLRGGGGAPPPASVGTPITLHDDAGGAPAGGAGGGGRVFVHVAGAVRRPGVYTLRAGARVADAVERAGGARPAADLSAVNLAAKLEDGRQVLVPRRGPAVGTSAGASTAAAPGAPTAPVNLNTATLEQLDTLDGVGPATAQKILAYRQEHGGFSSVEELGQVSGIGEKRMAALRDHVTV
jgi:competence protein ComEA